MASTMFELFGGYGAFFAGAKEAAQNLLAIEALAAAIFFDDHVGDFVDAFVGGESAITALTLAPAPNGVSFLAFARVHDPVLKKSAVGTLHAERFYRSGLWSVVCGPRDKGQGRVGIRDREIGLAEELRNRGHDRFLLVLAQLGEDGQGQHFAGGAFRLGEIAFASSRGSSGLPACASGTG